MEDDKLKRLYRNLLYSVNLIYGEVANLNEQLSQLNDILSESLIIDNNYIEENNLKSITTTTNNVQAELRNTVIPSIRYKSY